MSDLISRPSAFSPENAPPLELQVIPGERGPGLIYRGTTIHRADDPDGEAQEWARLALAQKIGSDPPRLALVCGVGLGWHIRRLKELFPAIKVAVYEPSREILEVHEKYNVLGRGENPQIFTDFASFEAFVSAAVPHGDGSFPVTLTVPGYASLFPEETRSFSARIAAEISRLRVILKTRAATDSAFTHNLVANAGLFPLIPDLALLKDRFVPRPAFAVGAGPSLSENGRHLREAKSRGLVICAGAALKPLLRMGVAPDVILVLESSDTSRFLKLNAQEREVLGDGAVLALAAGSHPEHFRQEGYARALFHLSGGDAQLFSQGIFLPQGGNAGTAAFALAYIWGLNPLILVGQDQAYSGTQLHAEGTADSLVETNFADAIKVPGIGGGEVFTNTGLLASVNWLAEAAALIGKSPKKIRLVNSSASGARVSGFEEIPLDIMVASLPPAPPTWSLSEILPKLPKPTHRELTGDLRQMSTLLSQLRRLARANLKRALIEMMNLSKASAFMGQLLAPALAGGHQNVILDKLSWADGIILKILASLEKTRDLAR
ncbi:MAG: DUF115 domain-containing protein [Deltaproteobacteria bacterium]|jgi:hypothetical protein|nr:DUF115 domain-containing protein [Deltaproteobacteria bacterium]